VAVLAPDGARLYVLTQQAHLLVIETKGPAISETLVLSDVGGPRSTRYGARLVMAPDGKQLYLTSGRSDNTLYAIEVGSWQTRAVGLPDDRDGWMADLAISPDGGRLYVLSSTELRVFNAQQLSQLGDLAFSDRRVRAFVTNPMSVRAAK
jgi:DNA-binding beta-propeller fold protein YncE